MSHRSDLIAKDIHAYLAQHEGKTLLRFITCGSVDDGKSSLIGRLLYDSKLIYEDQLAAVAKDSKKVGTTGDSPDLALLMDGLQSEREQGITIDVAYRYFSTEKRKFIIADTPGHEQYTRNMATGASLADLAIILIDARKGVLVQTRRHSFIVSLLGIRHILLAVNKMDLVGYDRAVFDNILAEYRAFAAKLGIEEVKAVPISALKGDNIVNRSDAMGWYGGPTLMEILETVDPDAGRDASALPFRFPVQWVNRPNLDFRGFAGTVAAGRIRAGDPVMALPSGKTSRVKSIVVYRGELPEAAAGQAATLTLEDEIDVSRGDMLVDPERRPAVSDHFEAHLVWMHEEAMLPNRQYLLKMGTRILPARITKLAARIDVNTLAREPANALALNEIGEAVLTLDAPTAFDSYGENRATGAFVLIDRLSNATVGAGMAIRPLKNAGAVPRHESLVGPAARAELKGQKPCLVWFTGLSGAGKSTIANEVEKRLLALGHHSYVLDANNLRHTVNSDLGFTDADRVENLRRAGEIGKMFVEAGLIVLACFISPYRHERRMIRAMLGAGEFLEVFVDTPLEICAGRESGGLYAKARAGEIQNVTGLDANYERPETPELRLDGAALAPGEAADRVVELLRARRIVR